ncbi:MAG: RrF2 family transcriptional regulator [Alphaproteobacteria bacterium]
MRLSRKMILALEAVVDIAYNARPTPVQSKEITRRQGIPQRYLEQVMQHLVHEGILRGVRGPRGGYRLATERRRLTAGDVVRTVAALEASEEQALESRSDLAETVIRPLIDGINESVMVRLDAITIEELCRKADEAGVENAARTSMDFTI